jgi:hypothetical protein
VRAAKGKKIVVQLDKVTSGQSRIAAVYELAWSTALQAMIGPIPKLTVRVRFRSPAPTDGVIPGVAHLGLILICTEGMAVAVSGPAV